MSTDPRLLSKPLSHLPRRDFLRGSLAGASGRLRVLATSGATRTAQLPEVPSLAAAWASAALVSTGRQAGRPIVQVLAALPEAAQRAAWDDMTTQLARFDTPGGWNGPNELLLCAAARPQDNDFQATAYPRPQPGERQ